MARQLQRPIFPLTFLNRSPLRTTTRSSQPVSISPHPGLAAKTRRFVTALVCLLPPILAHSPALQASTGQDSSNTIAFEDCKIGIAPQQLNAKCTKLTVPLNPKEPNAGTIDLSIAKLEARRFSGHQDALTFLAGGPGQSAIETFPSVAFAFRHIQADRDVILIDQRGTGDSQRLDCQNEDKNTTLDSPVHAPDDPEQIAAEAADCLAELPADPAFFTTSVAVQDLELVRERLGVSQWNLYGISYGTRVAAHYARRYPESVRSMIVDAVVPPQIALGPDIASLAQDTLTDIFTRCEADAGCNDAIGNLTNATIELVNELKQTPRTIVFEDIATGESTTREFTHHDLALTLRLMSYSAQTAAILPSMLFQAIENNNLAPLARQANRLGNSLSASLASGMHHAIVCTEDVPFFETAGQTPTEPSYLGADVVGAISATCEQWPAGVIDDDFKAPLTTDTPSLILSGAADPITPPAYGDMLANTLTNAKHIVNPAQGHMQAPLGCVPILMAQFVETVQPDELDTHCLERLRPTAFFVDANGPLP